MPATEKIYGRRVPSDSGNGGAWDISEVPCRHYDDDESQLQQSVPLTGRLAALAVCATFLAAQPTVVCDLACAIGAHRGAEAPPIMMAVQVHDSHGATMCCDGNQVGALRVPPAALVVTTSLPVAGATLTIPLETTDAARRPATPPAASVLRAVEPPPPRIR